LQSIFSNTEGDEMINCEKLNLIGLA
jgi:hypothetical protein